MVFVVLLGELHDILSNDFLDFGVCVDVIQNCLDLDHYFLPAVFLGLILQGLDDLFLLLHH